MLKIVIDCGTVTKAALLDEAAKAERIRAAEVAVIEIAEKWQEFMCSDEPDVPSLDYYGKGAKLDDKMEEAVRNLQAARGA